MMSKGVTILTNYVKRLCVVLLCLGISLCVTSCVKSSSNHNDDNVSDTTTTSPPIITTTETVTTIGTAYIINMNTKKFHYPDCPSVEQMNEKNKREYTGDRNVLVSRGYSPCHRCEP